MFVGSLKILKSIRQQWTLTRLKDVLHSRNGQISGSHFLILLLKMSIDLEDLMFSGINS